MYSIYMLDIDDIIVYCILLVIAVFLKFIEDLLDFKRFAKEYYFLDINIFRFSLILFKDKLKIM